MSRALRRADRETTFSTSSGRSKDRLEERARQAFPLAAQCEFTIEPGQIGQVRGLEADGRDQLRRRGRANTVHEGPQLGRRALVDGGPRTGLTGHPRRARDRLPAGHRGRMVSQILEKPAFAHEEQEPPGTIGAGLLVYPLGEPGEHGPEHGRPRLPRELLRTVDLPTR